jgi:hypothetical protein
MQTNLRKIVAEAWFHEGASFGIERPAGEAQCLVDSGRGRDGVYRRPGTAARHGRRFGRAEDGVGGRVGLVFQGIVDGADGELRLDGEGAMRRRRGENGGPAEIKDAAAGLALQGRAGAIAHRHRLI